MASVQRSGVVLVLLLLGCFVAEAYGNRGSMPLLDSSSASNHWGYIEGFDVLNSDQQEDLDEMREEAEDAGMDVSRIFTTWAALNPDEGVYDLDELTMELMNNFQKGIRTFVSVTTLDSEGLDDVPDRFKDDQSPSGLATTWTSTEMISSYNALMDRIVPLCEQFGGFALSIANEPQFYLEDFPSEEADFVEFSRQVIAHIHTLSDVVPATISLAYHDLDRQGNVDMLDLSDVISVNLYGEATGNPGPQTWIDPIQDVEQRVAPKQIVFQEMGLSSDNEGSSTELQAEYITTVSNYMQSSQQLRVLFWFLIHDPLDAFLDASTDGLLEEGVPADFVQFLRDSLGGLGMCTPFENGCTLKQPTWNTYLGELEAIAASNAASQSVSTASPRSPVGSPSSPGSQSVSSFDDSTDSSAKMTTPTLSLAAVLLIAMLVL